MEGVVLKRKKCWGITSVRLRNNYATIEFRIWRNAMKLSSKISGSMESFATEDYWLRTLFLPGIITGYWFELAIPTQCQIGLEMYNKNVLNVRALSQSWLSNYEYDKAVLKIWLKCFSAFLNIFLKRCALDRIYTATTTDLWKIL